jgi:hypothetical protein
MVLVERPNFQNYQESFLSLLKKRIPSQAFSLNPFILLIHYFITLTQSFPLEIFNL